MNFNYFLIIVGSIGFNIVFVYSSIFAPIRSYIESKSSLLGDLTSCPMCFGFWSGLIFGFIYKVDPLLLGFATSFLSWVSSNFVAFFSSGSSYFEQMEYINVVEKKDIFNYGENNE
jgi:hypothetical protein